MIAPALPPSRLCRQLLLVVMLAFVLAQALGAWHRARHSASSPAHADRGVACASATEAAADTSERISAEPDAFGHDAGSDACRLLDALTHADAPPPAYSVPVPPPARERVAECLHTFVAAVEVPFAARGPPAFH